MLDYNRIELPFVDATQYITEGPEKPLESFILRDEILNKLDNNSTYFLLGEKGSGKTAHAIYMKNWSKQICSMYYIQETDYRLFLETIKANNLDPIYKDLWILVLLFLSVNHIITEGKRIGGNINKLKGLHEATKSYYSKVFEPDRDAASKVIKKSGFFAKLITTIGLEFGYERNKEQQYDEAVINKNVQEIIKLMTDAIVPLRLEGKNILFIDGIDTRPHDFDQAEYNKCVKGLAEATIYLNSHLFPKHESTDGKLRIVLLLRPDIFFSINLHNSNAKLRDNGCFLDWRISSEGYRDSNLFRLADKILSSQQQSSVAFGAAWDYYFCDSSIGRRKVFPKIMDMTFHRPRDIVSFYRILKDAGWNGEKRNPFRMESVPNMVTSFSEYLLLEIKDQLSYFMPISSIDDVISFFRCLKGVRKFNYEYYLSAFKDHIRNMNKKHVSFPAKYSEPDSFLQLLYELNILTYIERSKSNNVWYRWAYRERFASNLFPKVKIEGEYMIHPGVSRSLNIGERYT